MNIVYVESNYLNTTELTHWGIKGMRWGVRRYQNKDGTLTAEGRRRLRLDVYDNKHDEDIVLKKGTRASRIVRTSDYEEYSDPEFNGSARNAKKYVNDVLNKDRELDTKYLSVDGVRNSGRTNGKDFYLSWFTNEGYDPNHAQVTMYTLTKDIKIASGKKVMDALLEEVGASRVESLLKDKYPSTTAQTLTREYTNDRVLRDRVNKRFIDAGYDGVEDINDLYTDLPIILFNATKNANRDRTVQSGKDALDEYFKKYSN